MKVTCCGDGRRFGDAAALGFAAAAAVEKVGNGCWSCDGAAAALGFAAASFEDEAVVAEALVVEMQRHWELLLLQ